MRRGEGAARRTYLADFYEESDEEIVDKAEVFVEAEDHCP